MYSKFKSYGSIYVSIYQILNHDIQVLKVNFQACEQFMPLWMSLFYHYFLINCGHSVTKFVLQSKENVNSFAMVSAHVK